MNHLTKKLDPGCHVPDDIQVLIEIPAQSAPVKYEVDKKTGFLSVDRFIGTAMYYPCNYGYIPSTLAADGDPLDALVLSPVPLLPTSLIRCRPIGLLKMEDESGVDGKVLAVPINKITSLYSQMQHPEDLPPSLLRTIAHFFEHYKDLEEGKWVKVAGWMDVEIAKAEILDCIDRYHDREIG